MKKENRLNIRCDKHSRELLNKAAAYAHVSVSEFVLSHALASAEQVIQSYESITLQANDFQAFLDALDRPAETNPALERAFNRHNSQVEHRVSMQSVRMMASLIQRHLIAGNRY